MKVLVVGGLATEDGDLARLHRVSAELGAALHDGSHETVICSTEPDSTDVHVVRGILEAAGDNAVKVSAHLPQQPLVEQWTEALEKRHHPRLLLQPTWHPTPPLDDLETRSYAYLMCQLLAALECDLIIALGGRPGRAADLLLTVGGAQLKPILPLRWLGGAAAEHYGREQEQYKAVLEHDVNVLADETRIAELPSLFDRVAGRHRPANDEFFISYSRSQAAFADVVENVLHAHQLRVSRDDNDLSVGSAWRPAIEQSVAAAGVVIVLWSVAYVSSPHCFAEMAQTLKLREESGQASPELWVFPLDETRMTFPGVDELLHADISITREALRDRLKIRLSEWLTR